MRLSCATSPITAGRCIWPIGAKGTSTREFFLRAPGSLSASTWKPEVDGEQEEKALKGEKIDTAVYLFIDHSKNADQWGDPKRRALGAWHNDQISSSARKPRWAVSSVRTAQDTAPRMSRPTRRSGSGHLAVLATR